MSPENKPDARIGTIVATYHLRMRGTEYHYVRYAEITDETSNKDAHCRVNYLIPLERIIGIDTKQSQQHRGRKVIFIPKGWWDQFHDKIVPECARREFDTIGEYHTVAYAALYEEGNDHAQ